MTMHDNRTDKTYKIEIRNNKMKASDLFDINPVIDETSRKF